MAKKNTVIAIASNQQQVEIILSGLQRAGFGNNDISALFPDTTGTRDFAHEQHTKAPEGALGGVGIGGAIGGTLGLLAGVGALAIPGVGPFLAAGPIMAALSGAAAGAAVGGVTGALIGMGIPEIQAKQYEGKIRSGNILLSIHIGNSDESARAKKVLEANGVIDIVMTGEASVPREARA